MISVYYIGQDPISDIPTIETNQYKYYADGTYQCYHLFNSKAKNNNI